MRHFKASLLLTALAATVGLSNASVGAQTQTPKFRSDVVVRGGLLPGATRDHFLTFSGPVAIPGVSLGPGTYVFRGLGPGVLQVLSADREHVYATAFTFPAERPTVTDKYEVWFGEPTTTHSPQRIVAWFHPGEAEGQELIYPSASRPRGNSN